MKEYSAKTPVELCAKIYKAHGWKRVPRENRWRRVKELYTISVDHAGERLVATPKPAA